jgi:PPE-repeat protein
MLLAELTQVQATAATTAAAGWQGAGGVAMVGSAQEYAAALELAAAWCLEAFAQATEVAMAHQTTMQSMIPAPVCTTNLATTQALCDTNFFGQNSPAIAALIAQYQEFWTQNASLANGYQGVITQALGVLSTPPSLSPTAANPAGPEAAAAANSAQSATQGALQTSAKSMTETADATGGAGTTSAASPMGSMSSTLGQLSSIGGQSSGMGGQLPQLLTSAPGQLSGMFGPMSSMFSGMGGAQNVGALGPAAASPLTAGGSAVSGLGGAGGVGSVSSGVFTSAPASATMVRPASSFSSASAPRLPGGWAAGSGAAAEPVAAPSSGGGGLYGAPAGAAMAGRDQNSGTERTPDRTMQVTGRPAHDGGERQRT